MNNNSSIWNGIGWLFGMVVFAIGTVNLFWGNDPGFGLFLILLSFVYYPPVNVLIRKNIGWSIPGILKFFLGAFIIWASLGVGELFDKVDMMISDLS
jgi:hypothetical protein